MKGPVLIFALLFLTLAFVYPTYALSPKRLDPAIRQERKEIKNQFQEKIQELKNDLKKRLSSLRAQIAKIINGEVTAISGSSLTVKKDDNTYTVNTDSDTHFRRHYWGGSSLDEFSVGNKVNVSGKFTDEEKTTILARIIRNLSIMKRHGVFMGDVSAKNSDNFIIDSKHRDGQTVYFDSGSKFVKRDETSMVYADLQVGHRVRVKGLWDKTLNQITEVVQVKDFSLPPRPLKINEPTATVVPTATLTMTATPTP
ncbi:hypothetical protein A2774_00045 [Candidatus Roizmanbacteria bacterium RIFCSPHIGHO2_01_FULL_39_12c]|uniref:DUF5666 domain-containing protein n=1 Tax=Candidatus Roizmanbacteria bacterium RIFCSPHIGHO2_01_FULL_39_12c TaxID=1802031 RepID=A0A1F7GCR4_9BACT|nr:MAG: hypothetical protein A2774_00045 [Candidatus Roizmanbacteria bacterium RIFCSPHIGHO2_01_FULL_39_12c]